MKHVDTRSAKSKYLEVSELGTRFNLTFSSQLEFGNKIIALDGRKKCLLVLETGTDAGLPYVIDLKDVVAVTIKRSYGSIKHGDLRNKGIEAFLKTIDLQFEFGKKAKTIVLPFYEAGTDDERERLKLDRNARNWQMILSKMTGSK